LRFLSLGGCARLWRRPWDRLASLAPVERTWVVAPARLAGRVRRALPELRRDRLVLEPSPRDTAPAIALGCAAVHDVDPRAIVGVFPTDHLIDDARAFRRAVRVAVRAARAGALVCLGIRPDRPATGYGYLGLGGPSGRTPGAMRVRRFVEKPDSARARRYVASGRFLWNGGMFVWRVDRFLGDLAALAPAIHEAVRDHRRGIADGWERATRISVDYAVMERASGVEAVPLDAGWDDLGSWDAAAARSASPRDVPGSAILVDSPGSVVFAEGRQVAVVDVPGVVVVDSGDAVLVVRRGSGERVKAVVDALRRRGQDDLL
jgi:mannose-1-phosphate guanylyltransferase